MLGEKVGAPPGRDPSTDAAWLYLADPDRRPEFEWRAENAGRLVPPERKADVLRWIAELLTPRGLRRLRALAQELWVHAGSPCASATGEPIAVAGVNWSACWAWCVAPTLPNRCRTRSDGHDALTFLYANSLPSLRDCHIAATPASEVHVAGGLLFILVKSLINATVVVPPSPAICPIDLEMADKSDFYSGIGSRAWCSIHPCMHWCGREGLLRWTADPKQNGRCPVCRTEILFMLGPHNRKSRE